MLVAIAPAVADVTETSVDDIVVTGPLGSGGGFSLRVASKDDGEPVTGTATFCYTSNLQAVISVNNLFDEDCYEAIGFPTVGLRVRFGIRYQF